MDIESLANSYNDGNPQLVSMFEHPSLLFGAAQSNPENIGSCAIDLFGNRIIFFLSQLPKGR
jgi:hypothetical protein